MSAGGQDGAKARKPAWAGRLLGVAIAAQIPIMLAVALWNFNDARLETQTFSNAILLRSPTTTMAETLPQDLARVLGGLLWLAVFLGIFSCSALLWASSRFRSIRYAALLCSMLAIWLAIFTQWGHISWLGHRARAAAVVEQLGPIAVQLNNNWPQIDGRNDTFGPFMAYPNGKPRTLILLTPLPIGNQFGSLAAIDRGSSGKLRFELSRGVDSLWLEWAPKPVTPKEEPAKNVPAKNARLNEMKSSGFTNGIGASYQRSDSIPIDDQWTVSRYE